MVRGLDRRRITEWRRAAATLAAEQADHEAEWRERRLRRVELAQAIEVRREELKAIRQAVRKEAGARLRNT